LDRFDGWPHFRAQNEPSRVRGFALSRAHPWFQSIDNPREALALRD